MKPSLSDSVAAQRVVAALVAGVEHSWPSVASRLRNASDRTLPLDDQWGCSQLFAAALSGELGTLPTLSHIERAKRRTQLTLRAAFASGFCGVMNESVVKSSALYSMAAEKAFSAGQSPGKAVAFEFLMNSLRGQIAGVARANEDTATIEVDSGLMSSLELSIRVLVGQWAKLNSEYNLI